MAEIEQPEPSEVDADSAFEGLEDVEERGYDILDQARLDGIAYLASAPATYWLTLKEHGLPVSACTAITGEWMHICAGTSDDDDDV